MCRLAGYLGPPIPLSRLLYDPPRSLEVQSYLPREQRSGHVNTDGTGVAWWNGDEPEPLRYATERTAWADENLSALSRRLTSGLQLAAVRSATPGIDGGAAAVAPFVHGDIAAIHNGWVGGFRAHTRRPLMEALPDHLLAAFDGASDSQLITLHVLAAREREPGAGLVRALDAATSAIARVCRREGQQATLTVVIADGRRMTGVHTAVDTEANSLYSLQDGQGWPGAIMLASEPLDGEAGWEPVPVDHLFDASPAGLVCTAL